MGFIEGEEGFLLQWTGGLRVCWGRGWLIGLLGGV